MIRTGRVGGLELSIVDEYELSEFQDRTWGLILALFAIVFGVTFNRSSLEPRSLWLRVYLGWWCLEAYWDAREW